MNKSLTIRTIITAALVTMFLLLSTDIGLAQDQFYAFGLSQLSLGQARLQFDTPLVDQITVSNIGGSGLDGLRVATGSVEYGRVRLSELDPAQIQTGASRRTTAFGRKADGQEQVLGFLLELCGPDTLLYQCGFPAFGAGLATVEVYRNGVSVARVSDVSTDRPVAKIVQRTGPVTIDICRLEEDGTQSIRVDYLSDMTLFLSSGQVAVGNQLVIKSTLTPPEEEPGWESQCLTTSIAVTAKDLGSFIVLGEAIGLWGNSHVALGQAHFGGGDVGPAGFGGGDVGPAGFGGGDVGPAGFMFVENIGSSGRDGVRLAADQRNRAIDEQTEYKLAWAEPDMAAGAFFQLSSEDEGGQEGEDFAAIRCDKTVFGWNVGAVETTSPDLLYVEIWNDSNLVAKYVYYGNPFATVGATPTGAIVGNRTMSFTWTESVQIAAAGHAPKNGTELRFVYDPMTRLKMPDIFFGNIGTFYILDTDAGDAICRTQTVAMDVMPGLCPNRVRLSDINSPRPEAGTKSDGGQTGEPAAPNEDGLSMIRVCLLGSESFDVRDMDPASIRLGSARPTRTIVGDRVSQSIDEYGDPNCHILGTDGYDDLNLRFRTADLWPPNHKLEPGDQEKLVLTGRLRDGTQIDAVDYVVVFGEPTIAPAIDTELHLTSYPNPANPSTTISFQMPSAGQYSLTIFNLLGQIVDEFSAYAEAGPVSVRWDAIGKASGVYLYRVAVNGQSATEKVVLLK